MAHLFRKGYNSNILSDSKVVTKAICSAVKSRRPKTRYKVGLGSNLIVILHSILPTRCWDALMRCMGRIKIDN